MNVDRFMTRNPVVCDAADTVETVARLMRDAGVGFVIVTRNERVAGIVTDRALVTRVLARGSSGRAIPVDAVMTRNPATVTLEDDLFSVIDTLRSAGVARRVPVVTEAGRPIGVVSLSDVAVIAKRTVDAILLEETRHALKEARVPTGGRRLRESIERPSRKRRARRAGRSRASRAL